MQILHRIGETISHMKLVRLNLKRARGIRSDYSMTEDGFTYKRGGSEYLREIELLHIALFGQPLLGFLRLIYRFMARELMSVVVDDKGRLIAYDLFFFEPSELDKNILHELYVGVRSDYQNRGVGVKLRRYSASCYDNSSLEGLSTLAHFDNIKALRSAQKSGYAIQKKSAKPPAYYLYLPLNKRF